MKKSTLKAIIVSAVGVVAVMFLPEATALGTAFQVANYTNYNANSPFHTDFGDLAQQDADGGMNETVSGTDTTPTNYYDFRGLGASATAGQTYFFLEDWQDGQTDAPGVTNTPVTKAYERTNNGRSYSETKATDNVAEDTAYGQGALRISDTSEITTTFNATVLGQLPTHVGLVLTEGARYVTQFDAYDNDNNLVASTNMSASVTEDHFIGVIAAAGIKEVKWKLIGGAEIDHLQFGRYVPPPAGTVIIIQ